MARHDALEKAMGELQSHLRGPILQPPDPTYDEARRVYNALHDQRPALVLRAAGVADVMAAVGFARAHGLTLAVRGGGHSVAGFGTCDGGLVIDLQRMRGIRVDPARRTVRAEGGCTWADLNHATHAFGLATTGGIVSTTGIAGLTLGGGLGYLARSCGLSCDNLVSADVVTADGAFLVCSEEQNADLFWALRGGGGNFGVVTSFEYRLHPVAEIIGGPTFFPLEAEVLHRYRELLANAPEALGALLGLTLAPPLPFVPDRWHGKPVSVLVACWTGAAAEGRAILDEVQKWAPVVGRMVGPMPYPAINTLFDELLPAGLRHYWKGVFARQLTDGAIAAHMQYARHIPCAETATIVFPIDGACHSVADDATAFAHRRARFATALGPSWRDANHDTANIDWGRRYYEALRPHSDEAGYVNFMSADDQHRVRENYGANYERLVAVKRRCDPGNLFQLNQNISPY